MNRCIIVLVVLSLGCFKGFAQDVKAARNIEQLISATVDKALGSSVYIIEYDTVKNQVQEGIEEAAGFTGVVVSAEGHIWTVSHAASPRQVYRVSFPDGKQHIAVGLGRIGIQQDGMDLDLAMLKILKPGQWPYAEIARGSELTIGQPVISIAYPGTFFKPLPNVRYGQVSQLHAHGGYIESSAKMEPGDSGGPLFDGSGRLVGIRSWIQAGEDKNYDVPTDLFLKYWTALSVAQDYKVLPDTDAIPPLPVATGQLAAVPPLETLVKADKNKVGTVLRIHSDSGTEKVTILGTLLVADKSKGGIRHILSKSSMVFDDPQVDYAGQLWPAKILRRDRENDLVLLEVHADLPKGIQVAKQKVVRSTLGQIWVSYLPDRLIKSGVVSALPIDMLLLFSAGNFGAGATFIDNKITITRLQEGGAAAGILQKGDQVTAIQGVAIQQPADYGHELAKYMVGDFISVDILRGSTPLRLHLRMHAYPTARHVSYEYAGGRSPRSDGFQQVMVQDAAIRADECGGPVFNLAGEFVGINIARHSRTSTILLQTSVLKGFLLER